MRLFLLTIDDEDTGFPPAYFDGILLRLRSITEELLDAKLVHPEHYRISETEVEDPAAAEVQLTLLLPTEEDDAPGAA